MLDIELHIDDDTGDELRSLRRWLLDVPELRGRVTTHQQLPQEGELGAHPNSLILALEGATERAAESLGRTLSSWAEARRRTVSAHRLTIEARIGPDEVVLSIDTAVRDGQLDPSVRALVDEITTRLRYGRKADPPTSDTQVEAVDHAGEPAGFTDDELQTLAAAFPSRTSAETLLRDAGMKPETFTTFESAPSALAWWTETSRALALGKELYGRHRLLRAAAARYPASPTLNRVPRQNSASGH
ncbi:hypothetical protein I6A84_03890 [Frankia sp. CNm7]|uniref:Effector-associated domain-containing protein n=1 Tax=Frankia nepalensis TaxID=1836974 RepID=A0A937RIH5_9ACTN|nr:effector-associated domain EAD1-containing protein [Frankia nepalensis]MBL7500892.1 hypothetical protein [Frankia nepalensis]MBL7509258.1 hypothetical protein [Frankia nepalensis]MBL7517283.1 hypothetical protein [Frankia nepalensis]MBL7626978.1 hypothetical protein [Frankia nepalensis]